jgi:serine protease Do
MHIKIVSFYTVAALFFATVSQAQNVKQNEEVIILKKGSTEKQITVKIDGDKMTINGKPVSDSMKNSMLNNNEPQVKMMKVIVNGDKMTINGKPVSDSMKNSILNNNEGQVKMMKVIVDGDKMTINGNPLNDNSSIFEEKIIKGNKEKKMNFVVEGNEVFLNGEPVDASEFIQNGKTLFSNDSKKSGIKEIRINNNRNFNMPEMMLLQDLQPRMMLGVVVGKADNGLIIKEVVEGSVAESAGLKVDDIISKFNGAKLTEPKQLVDSVQSKKPGEVINLVVIKAGEKKETNFSIKFNKQNVSSQVRIFVEGEGPNDDGPVIEKDIQLQLHNLDFGNDKPLKKLFLQRMQQNEDFGDMKLQKPLLGIHVQEMEDSSGVKVFKVMESSLGASSGVKVNDVITAVDGKKVTDIPSITNYLDATKDKKSFQLKVKRNGNIINIDVKKQVKLKKAVL